MLNFLKKYLRNIQDGNFGLALEKELNTAFLGNTEPLVEVISCVYISTQPTHILSPTTHPINLYITSNVKKLPWFVWIYYFWKMYQYFLGMSCFQCIWVCGGNDPVFIDAPSPTFSPTQNSWYFLKFEYNFIQSNVRYFKYSMWSLNWITLDLKATSRGVIGYILPIEIPH